MYTPDVGVGEVDKGGTALALCTALLPRPLLLLLLAACGTVFLGLLALQLLMVVKDALQVVQGGKHGALAVITKACHSIGDRLAAGLVEEALVEQDAATPGAQEAQGAHEAQEGMCRWCCRENGIGCWHTWGTGGTGGVAVGPAAGEWNRMLLHLGHRRGCCGWHGRGVEKDAAAPEVHPWGTWRSATCHQ
jgi:hypothetical protein